uniref:Ig-like domain-containing protein n=1 Tax=Sinocyclocheilus anshuiensis TaxID=1608454 RepID=A0A671SC04_9TELE
MFVTGFSVNSAIKQTPSDLLSKNNVESVTLHCSHTNPNFNVILWYKQPLSGEMQLMGYLYRTNNNSEPVFKEKIELLGNGASNSNLILKKLSSDDNAIYYCAAMHVHCDSSASQAYFGNGTKLTVLEHDIRKPEVEILKPSGTETSCKQKVTLVCVAKNFYPDHVSITWTVGSKEIKDDVATDPYATQDKETKLFSITSRLKVSKKEFKPQNTFRCTVRFYNETDVSINRHGEINGIAGISLDTS